MEEIWKPVNVCDGVYSEHYLISNKGKCISLSRTISQENGRHKSLKKKLLKPNYTAGYTHYDLTSNKISRRFSAHRLVAYAFIDNPENKPYINHKDGQRDNNDVNNLEWCTAAENNLHAFRVNGRLPTKPMLGRKGEYHPASAMKGALNHRFGLRGEDSPMYGKRWAWEEESKMRMKGIVKFSKIVLNTQTGIYYDSAKEAALSINSDPSLLTKKLRGVRKNKTPFIYV